MEEDGFYCGASDWAKAVSNTVWHSPMLLDCGEAGDYQDELPIDWLGWLFRPFHAYTKLKQH